MRLTVILIALHILGRLGTAAAIDCVGDCGRDGAVTVNELIQGVNIALGNETVSACPDFDGDGNGLVTVNELIGGVNSALDGCDLPTPTLEPTATPTAPPTSTVHATSSPSPPFTAEPPTSTATPDESASPTSTALPMSPVPPTFTAPPMSPAPPTSTEQPTSTQPPTLTASPTSTPSETRTPSPTPSETRTPSPTSTPSRTRTPSPTATASRTRTPSPTPTPSFTLTFTETPTVTPTIIPATATPQGLLFDGTIAELVPHGLNDVLIYQLTRPGNVVIETNTVISMEVGGAFTIEHVAPGAHEKDLLADRGMDLLLRRKDDLIDEVRNECDPPLLQIRTPLFQGQLSGSNSICVFRTIVGNMQIGAAYPQTNSVTPIGLLESLTVPAGTYENVIHLRGIAKYLGNTETTNFFVAPGIGIIRSVTETAGDVRTRELFDGTIGGQSVRR